MRVQEDNYLIQFPNGEKHKVNIFDMNLASACDSYVETIDGIHIRARLCKCLMVLIKGEEHKKYTGFQYLTKQEG